MQRSGGFFGRAMLQSMAASGLSQRREYAASKDDSERKASGILHGGGGRHVWILQGARHLRS